MNEKNKYSSNQCCIKDGSRPTAYRYGFNGKEDDKDINSGVQDYGMRIYYGSLSRFLSVDH